MIKANTGGHSISYKYNGDGLRMNKNVNGTLTYHVWDGSNMVMEMNGSGTATAKYIRGINLISGKDAAGTVQYYLFNGHGDVTSLTDSAGNVKKNYTYDAFGNEKNPDPNDINVFRYTGEYFDKETGTIYLRARYYDPRMGRFVTEDSYWGSAGDPLSLNLYTYVANNPINFIDPSGHLLQEDIDKYGEGSVVCNSLDTLGRAYGLADTDEKRASIAALAQEVRRIADTAGGIEIIATTNALLAGKVNDTEIILTAGHPLRANIVNQCKDIVEEEVRLLFGKEADGENNNAFKHALWNALIADRVGVGSTKLFTDAHEFGAVDNLNIGIESVQKDLMNMDLFNNGVGRYQTTFLNSIHITELISAQGQSQSRSFDMRNARDKKLVQMIIELTRNGGLKRIDPSGGTRNTDGSNP